MIRSLFEKYKKIPIQLNAVLWFLICSFLQKGISTMTVPIFTRILSTTEYGQYSVFNSWLGILTVFITLNLYSGVFTQGLIKFDQERDSFSSALLGLTTILAVIFTVIYLCFYKFWNRVFSLTTVQMLAMLVLIWTSSVFNFWAARQRVEYKYKALVVVTIIVSVLKPVVGVIFVILAKDKVMARILGLVLVELVGYTGLYIIQMRRGKSFFSKRIWRYALLFNLPLVPHYLSQIILNSADRIMISNMIGTEQAGIYSLAYNISQIMTLFNTALMQTLSPWIYEKIKQKQLHKLSGIAYTSLITIAIFNLILIVFAPEIVRFFAPSAYYNAIWVIPPVAMSVYFMFAYDFFAKFGFYYEKTKFIMLASVIGALLNIILNWIFIPIFGYYAAGYTTLACYIIYTTAHYYSMNKICSNLIDGSQPYSTKKIICISLVFIILGFLILATYNYTLIRYCCGILGLGLIVYFRKHIMVVVNRLYRMKQD